LDDVRDGKRNVADRVALLVPEHNESAYDELREESFGNAYLLTMEHAPTEHAVDALPFRRLADRTFASPVAPETSEREEDTNDLRDVPSSMAHELQLQKPARVFIQQGELLDEFHMRRQRTRDLIGAVPALRMRNGRLNKSNGSAHEAPPMSMNPAPFRWVMDPAERTRFSRPCGKTAGF
jgi:hypothetical protein